MYVLLLFTYSKYSKFQWRTFREKLIITLRYNYASETKENFETLIYQGIEQKIKKKYKNKPSKWWDNVNFFWIFQ